MNIKRQVAYIVLEKTSTILINYIMGLASGFFAYLVSLFFILTPLMIGLIFIFTTAVIADTIDKAKKIENKNEQVLNTYKKSDKIKGDMPIIKDKLSKIELALLTSIRGAEWGGREENSLDGDRDSCGAYQQRINEIANENSFLGIKSKKVLGDNLYQQVFSPSRISNLNTVKNSPNARNVKTEITDGYGNTGSRIHYGVDIGSMTGTPVISVDYGKVIFNSWDNAGGGNVIIIESNKLYYLYAHLDISFVKIGNEVRAGQIIANSGNTGGSTGPHLHFQIFTSLDGGWNANTIDVTKGKFIFEMNLNRNIILGLCYDLTQLHLNNGLFDYLAIERLKNNPNTRNYFNGIMPEPTKKDIENIISAACASQAPMEYQNGKCIEKGWKERAREALNKANIF